MNLMRAMQAFSDVVEEGGFAAAARREGLSKAQISRLVSGLEDYLGVKLLNRSTRQFSLTDEGQVYLEHARGLLEENKLIESQFSEARVKKSTGKILLMAAYLQERHNFKEITTYDINFRLKRIKHGVTNISSIINGILKGKPQLLDEIKNEEQTKHARRKFKVTEEGLKVAESYL